MAKDRFTSEVTEEILAGYMLSVDSGKLSITPVDGWSVGTARVNLHPGDLVEHGRPQPPYSPMSELLEPLSKLPTQTP